MDLDDLLSFDVRWKYALVSVIFTAVYFAVAFLCEGKLHEYLWNGLTLRFSFGLLLSCLVVSSIKRDGLVIGAFRVSREESSSTYHFFLRFFYLLTVLCCAGLIVTYLLIEETPKEENFLPDKWSASP